MSALAISSQVRALSMLAIDLKTHEVVLLERTCPCGTRMVLQIPHHDKCESAGGTLELSQANVQKLWAEKASPMKCREKNYSHAMNHKRLTFYRLIQVRDV